MLWNLQQIYDTCLNVLLNPEFVSKFDHYLAELRQLSTDF